MFFWFTVILISLVIVGSMGSIIWTLARGSNAQRRKTLVALLLNRELNAAVEPSGSSARERREAKRAVWQQHQQQHAKSRAQAAHSHGGSNSGHHGNSAGYHSTHHGHSTGHHSAHSGDFGGGHGTHGGDFGGGHH